MPRRISGPTCTRATSRSSTGVPPSLSITGDRAEVVERLEVAARADHVLGFGELDHRAAGFAVGVADRRDHLRERQVVRAQPRRIDDDLVLPHHAADRRDFGDVRHATSART